MEGDWFGRLYERSQKSLGKISADDFLALLRPKCREVVTREGLEELLRSGRKLRVKFGIDATGAEIHLGHAVPLMLLRLFGRAGHEIHFVVGDFTGKIGDPSGRTDNRRQITDKEITTNLKTYAKQVTPILDLKKVKVHQNSKWLSRMRLAEFFEMIGAISFGEVAQREDFRARLKAGSPVSLREANYASLMAIDSVELKADIEVGGIDQLLNFMQARSVMEAQGMKPEVVLTTPLIEGTAGDGRKMSKSFGNYITLGASADDQFGLIMSIPDTIIESYVVSFGDIREDELDELRAFIKINPFEAKKQLAMLIVSIFHSEKSARDARDAFERKFSRKEFSGSDAIDIRMKVLPAPLFDALMRALGDEYSRSQIRTLISQRAIRRLADGAETVLADQADLVRAGDIIKVGKLHLFRFNE
ncbi:MAG: tyrosine--tRNA ligase [Candidatus Ryanbacteria bacterium]|nr:tyrosine--tRNA ligase [Candidatus Ryanbacteria bacterium]